MPPQQVVKDLTKNLCLDTGKQSAWLYVVLANEEDLLAEDLLLVDVRVQEPPPHDCSSNSWERRGGGIWVLRRKFSGKIDEAVTEVDVLFGTNAVDPRPQWKLMQSSLQLNAQPTVTVARLSVLYGRAKPISDPRAVLRVEEDGTFKILQISDTHMVTLDGTCTDRSDAHRKKLPDSDDADLRTVNLICKILDEEKPNFVVLSGDLLHHGIPHSKTAILKLLAPIIERSIPFAAVFGNHDSEGTHALSRTAQMSIFQGLPLCLSESGPEQVGGVGNFHVEVLGPAPSEVPALNLYFLDSHGEIPNWRQKPDYAPIEESQIRWFRNVRQAQRGLHNDSCLRASIVFMHIPLPEFKDPRLLIRSGHRAEPTECPSVNSHFYDALAEEGVSALGCGHDHVNDFCALMPQQKRRGGGESHDHRPWLCHAGAAGYGVYCSYGYEFFQRGARVWELRNNVLKTWRRREHDEERVDELVLVENRAVVDVLGGEGGATSCAVS
ncbi:Metallo-dependent phosphatase-like protein [Ampelomyces quisqualis]|uniref:Metallo-dependent phosphatase-like protein n=1 Tax=Ampelomyces quisqualis TaxID=50730 RepID=A0A6A5QBA9_AMPQU|nr:Metallo-dependent phosphatase-like protein [Ampelomyces quisqualis]